MAALGGSTRSEWPRPLLRASEPMLAKAGERSVRLRESLLHRIGSGVYCRRQDKGVETLDADQNRARRVVVVGAASSRSRLASYIRKAPGTLQVWGRPRGGGAGGMIPPAFARSGSANCNLADSHASHPIVCQIIDQMLQKTARA